MAFIFFVQSLFFNVNVTGWPTIVVSIMFFSGVQLISLGVLGEYISRIFDEAKNVLDILLMKMKVEIFKILF